MKNSKWKESGFTMVEMVMTMALASVLGVIVYGVVNFADKQTKVQTEDIQNLIQRFGASKILVRDIANAAPSFNYLNFKDDNDRPFFNLALSEYCKSPNCNRSFTMSIAPGETVSKPFFLLVTDGLPNEFLNYTIDPISLFNDSNTYEGINPGYASPETSIAKSEDSPDRPWTKNRLILFQSRNLFYDCMNSVHTFNPSPSGSCDIHCSPSGSCDYATTRPLKVIGSVIDNELDISYTSVLNRTDLFKNEYKICSPDKDLNCQIRPDYSDGKPLTTSRDLVEKMPYVPGSDNLASITPVALVRYHLERPTANSPDAKIVLMRSQATIVGGQLSFERAHLLMAGMQSIVFTRRNISNPTIEYKLNKVRLQQAVK